jgi:hypothetical protein
MSVPAAELCFGANAVSKSQMNPSQSLSEGLMNAHHSPAASGFLHVRPLQFMA